MSAPISLRLTGKVAIVTGASRGIGAAIAGQLGAEGAKVVCNYLSNAAAAQAVVDGILASGGKHAPCRPMSARWQPLHRSWPKLSSAMGGWTSW